MWLWCEFDEGSSIFNWFGSVTSYKTEEKPIFSFNAIASAESMSIYDNIEADVLQNYHEHNLVNIIHCSLKEPTTSEQSRRMVAMDNVSKNASEMIDKLTLTFQLTCQPVIITWVNWNHLQCCSSGLTKIKFHPQARGKEGKFSKLILFLAYCCPGRQKLLIHCLND